VSRAFEKMTPRREQIGDRGLVMAYFSYVCGKNQKKKKKKMPKK